MPLLFSLHIIPKTAIKDKLKVNAQMGQKMNKHKDTQTWNWQLWLEAHKWQNSFFMIEYTLQLNIKTKGDSDIN